MAAPISQATRCSLRTDSADTMPPCHGVNPFGGANSVVTYCSSVVSSTRATGPWFPVCSYANAAALPEAAAAATTQSRPSRRSRRAVTSMVSSVTSAASRPSVVGCDAHPSVGGATTGRTAGAVARAAPRVA